MPNSLMEYDPQLKNFEGHLQYRWSQFIKAKSAIEEAEGALADFSCGHTQLGITKAADGTLTYREWLPAAKEVSLYGDFNDWDDQAHQLQQTESGVWELQLPAGAIPHGSRYKIRVWRHDGGHVDCLPAWVKYSRPDPEVMGSAYDGIYWDPPLEEAFAGFKAPRPSLGAEALQGTQSPRVYEAHVGMSSTEPECATYRSFADNVLPRVKAMGYNTVQLMAIMEHSYYASFGYHVTAPFAVSSRSGSPDDFKYLVETAHTLGLLVLVDLVHSHVSTNLTDGLNALDFGQPEADNYFCSGERGYHWLWDSRLYNYSGWEVKRYLLSNLRWWVEEYNCDGFRFDGVTSMLYHHHGLQMEFTGDYKQYMSEDTNVDAVVYLMLACSLMKELYPDNPPLMIAEDVSGMPALCRPVAEGGVGFDYRLGMGIPDMWGNLLSSGIRDEDWSMSVIVSTLCNRRRGYEGTIGYTECHDQSIVGSKTVAFWLMDKDMYDGMGDDGTPGSVRISRGVALHKLVRTVTLGLGGEGYLNFMGNEFGHPEWIDFPREGNSWSYAKCCRRWDLADNGLLRYKHLLKWDLGLMALEAATCFASDEHLIVSSQNDKDKVIVFERGPLLFVCNFHPSQLYTDYKFGVRDPGRYKVCLDSDAYEFGGEGRVPHDWTYFSDPEGVPGGEGNFNNRAASITVQVFPPRSVQVYERLREPGEEAALSPSTETLEEAPCWHAARKAIDPWVFT